MWISIYLEIRENFQLPSLEDLHSSLLLHFPKDIIYFYPRKIEQVASPKELNPKMGQHPKILSNSTSTQY